jgi:hypothetical protein
VGIVRGQKGTMTAEEFKQAAIADRNRLFEAEHLLRLALAEMQGRVAYANSVVTQSDWYVANTPDEAFETYYFMTSAATFTPLETAVTCIRWQELK